MPAPSLQKIEAFRRAAIAKGYNEQQIAASLARMQQNATKASLQQPKTPTQPTINTPAPQPQQSMLSKVGNAVVGAGKAVFSAPARLGEALGNAGAFNQNVTQNQQSENQLLSQVNQLNAKADQAEQAGNKAQAQRLRKLAQENLEMVNKNAKALATTAENTNEDAIKGGVGTAAMFVPGGKAAKTRIATGALSGGLSGFGASKKGEELASTAGGAVTGALISGAIEAPGAIKNKVIKPLFNKSKKATQGSLEETAIKSITKASPTAWRNAAEQHGLDLNALTKKYFPKGGTYDDLLGPIKDRGNGGTFKEVIQKSEGEINKVLKSGNANTRISIDDFVKELKKEAKTIAKMPGNEGNVEALNEFIKGTVAKYGKGITPKQMLTLKRAADSKFGQAVADETTGSATAQAQKMFANSARSTLKKLFPEIKDALDTETEVYTIRPVLSHARSILKTQGSSIRVGSMKGKSLNDLLNPLSWVESYMADPKRASNFLIKGGDEAAQSILKQPVKSPSGLITPANRIATGTLIAGGAGGREEQPGMEDQTNNTQYDTNQEKESGDIQSEANQSTLLDSTDTTQTTTHPIFGTMTKKEVLLDAFKQGLNQKELNELSTIYDQFAPDDQMNDEQLNTLMDRRKKLADQGFSTEAIDKQLEAMGVTRSTSSGSNIIDQINNLGTVGERGNARAAKDILDVVNTAITEAEGTSTGPIAALQAEVSKLTGPNKTAKLEKDLAEILRTIRKESTGVAFSPEEIKALLVEIPTIVQQEGNVKDSLKRLKTRMLQKLQNQGIDVSSEMNE